MTDDERQDVLRQLRDVMSLWRIQPSRGSQLLIDTATAALVADVDSPALRELAGTSPKASGFELQALVDATRHELGLEAATGTDEDQVRAARAMCRQMLAGEMTPRELATWAHKTIRHDGAERLQRLVECDDDYDILGLTDPTSDDIGRQVVEEARSLTHEAGTGA